MTFFNGRFFSILGAILGLTIYPFSISCQEVPIGQWRDHLTYSKVECVALANGKVYAASESGIFSVHPEDESIHRLSTINGLSNIKATTIGSPNESGKLYVGYETGVFDIISGTNIEHVFSVKRSNIIGNKQINHFNFYSDETAFISTGFGVLQFNLTRNEIEETFFVKPNGEYVFVNATEVFDNKLYAATDNGIYYCSLTTDLFDPSNWKKDQTLPKPNKNYNLIVAFGNSLIINQPSKGFRQDSLFEFKSGTWNFRVDLYPESNQSIEVNQDKIVIANSTSVEVYDDNWNNVQRVFTVNESGISPLYATYNANNEIWFGDFTKGLVKSASPFDNTPYLITGPSSSNAFDIRYSSGSVYVAGGGHSNWSTFKENAEISIFEDEKWNNFSAINAAQLALLKDLTSITANPKNTGEVYASTINGGIIHILDNKIVNQLDIKNSILEPVLDSLLFVSDISYDQSGSLWIANSATEYPIKVLANDNEWYKFRILKEGQIIKTGNITITSEGVIWLSLQDDGILVLDPGDNFGDTSDDKIKFFTSAAGDGGLPSNSVNAITEDESGNIWIATSTGLKVFYNAANVFDANYGDAKEILINQDGQTKILFENQNITDIVVDPANRKWCSAIGSGVYLMSEDGTTEVAHFTEENSPLYSNIVQSIALNTQSGELFIGTDKGLIGYRSDVTESANSFNNLLAFPNPAMLGTDKIVGITGISDKTEVIISDAGGNLVFRTVSNGGTATWDLTNLHGEKVVPGVYLVFAVDSKGKESGVAKVAVLR